MWRLSVITAAQDALSAAAESGTAGSETPQSPFPLWMFFVAMLAIMYFFLFRPQQKRERERKDMMAKLSKGDRIMTTGGILGTIVGLNEKSVVLRVSDEPIVKIEFARGAISRVMSSDDSKDGKELAE